MQPDRKAPSAHKELKATPVPQVLWGQSVQLDPKGSRARKAHKDSKATRELVVLLGQLV